MKKIISFAIIIVILLGIYLGASMFWPATVPRMVVLPKPESSIEGNKMLKLSANTLHFERNFLGPNERVLV